VAWKPGDGFGRDISAKKKGLTDVDGHVTLSTASRTGHFGYLVATPPGYYKDRGGSVSSTSIQAGRWEPWDQTVEILVKSIVNPIAMYAKHVETKLWADATQVGYDLSVGDWVAPYGKGKIGDFLFRVDRNITSDRDFKAVLQLGFANPSDGLSPQPQLDAKNSGSQLLLPRIATESGYVSERKWENGRSRNAAGPDSFAKTPEVPGYFFRVRTVLDDQGRVKSALYGKINGDIMLYAGTKAPHAGLGFTYYLNPTPNDRNVEFDPNKNLFQGFRGADVVTAP
jgi:hypothetical protein